MPDSKLITAAKTLSRFLPLTEEEKLNLRTAITQDKESVNLIDDKKGQTALMIAVINRNYELASFLVELGADPSIVDCENKKASDYFLENQTKIDLMPVEPQAALISVFNDLKWCCIDDLRFREIFKKVESISEKILESSDEKEKKSLYKQLQKKLEQFQELLEKPSDPVLDANKEQVLDVIHEYDNNNKRYTEYAQPKQSTHQKTARLELCSKLGVTIQAKASATGKGILSSKKAKNATVSNVEEEIPPADFEQRFKDAGFNTSIGPGSISRNSMYLPPAASVKK